MEGQTWALDNAEALNQQAPDSFFIPPEEHRRNLKQGDTVKLVFRLHERRPNGYDGERMRVEVIEVIEPGRYMGKLVDDPHYVTDLKYDDVIRFESQHVAAKDYSVVELGYDAGMHAAVNKRVRAGRETPRRLIYVADAAHWYVFVGDEDGQERHNGDNFEWWSLGDLTDRWPVMIEPFQNHERGGYWDLSPHDGTYDWFSF